MKVCRLTPMWEKTKKRLLQVGCLVLWFGLAALLSASSCSTVTKGKGLARKSYARNAKQLYQQALKALKGDNYQEARKLLQYLKTTYPFSSYATMADVRIGDTYFKAGKYLQAIDIYKMFVKLRPSHALAPYAAYRTSLSYYKMIPADWFLIPPAHEKDPTQTKQAITSFRDFLQSYPSDKLTVQAKKYLKKCLLQLANHEMYVAKFYASRGRYQAVAWRLNYLLKNYAGAGLDAEARYRLGKAYLKLKKRTEAKKVFQELLQLHPKSSYHAKARSSLTALSSAATSRPHPRQTTPGAVLSRPTARPTARPANRPVRSAPL